MDIVIAILAKNKGHCLPLYLKCIYNQIYDKKKLHLYIRTNDNTDNTKEVLDNFINDHGEEYASVYYNNNSISEELKKYDSHEWNSFRFKILGEIRQKSIDYAIKLGAHYFIADCDNYIVPDTLLKMYELRELGIVSPMLESLTAYSNYHYDVDVNGYYKDHENYGKIRNKEINGIFNVKVVHCTYFIGEKFLKDVNYDDNTMRYEYVIFSDTLRKKNISQYIDNRFFYGFLDFNTNEKDFKICLLGIKNWLKYFYPLKSFLTVKNQGENNKNEKILIISPQAGFSNRIRAICSAIVLGKYLNRKVYHAWLKEEDVRYISHIEDVREIQQFSFGDIFEENNIEPFYNIEENINICFTEWLPGQFWYPQQSSAYRKFGNSCEIRHVDNDADELEKCDLPVILLETSLIVKLKKYEDLWKKEMSDVYQKFFQINKKYSNKYTKNINIDIDI
jgi:hypothetical protein